LKHLLKLVIPPDIAYDPIRLKEYVRQELTLSHETVLEIHPLRRSIDARGRQIKINLEIEVWVDELAPEASYMPLYSDVSSSPRVIVVGAGPAGMFASLRLIELGLKPILLERGKDVKARRRDLAAINKEHIVHPESNYCFGEGGAGTYSDGKLYTRSKKRGDVRRILEILVAHGATSEILVDAHPHIGTNKLPKVVESLRNSILQARGEVHFNTKVDDLILHQDELRGVIASGKSFEGIGVILATGHSARDIFELLDKKKITIQAKPFALGVRVEHQQSLIDRIQYHCDSRGPYLPASSYALVEQVNHQGRERGVFSFCMCPGGFIVPAATAPGEVVVNGMSPSRRDSEYSNSGIVVAVELDELQAYQKHGALACLEFQKEVEQKAWLMGGKSQTAPAQLLQDFTKRKSSSHLLRTSYQPGLLSVEMGEVLPPMIAERLRVAFQAFGKKMKGYLSNEAQIIGVESRTSSPVQIPRSKETLEHIHTKRLFPCGEGAGYAGGIVSAAMDGERCAEQIAVMYGSKKLQ
jgi:hypothetical protein